MDRGPDLILVLVVLMNFLVLGTGAIRTCIRAAAAQGVLLSLLPLLLHEHGQWRAMLLAAGTAAIKGGVIPAMLFRAMRDVQIVQEVEPYIGFVPSLLLGAVGTTMAMLLSGRLPLAPEHQGLLIVPASLATLASGLIVLTTRRKAITQVVGYLLLDNGIFVFGMLLIGAMPTFVELGALLDLVVGIFIMGIVIHHIKREFSSLDTHHLSGLRES